MESSGSESNLDALRRLALAPEFDLDEEEAKSLLNGVRRNREFAERLRRLVTPEVEPAFTFAPGPHTSKPE